MKKFCSIFIIVWLSLCLEGINTPATPSEIFNVVTAPEVRYMIEDGELTLVNVLSEAEYAVQHIPGSVNIPVTEMETTDRLPSDKTAPVSFYGMGEGFFYTEIAAQTASRRGYTRLSVFTGGILEWREFNYPMVIDKEWQAVRVNKISPAELVRLMETENIYLLDVRPDDDRISETEYIQGGVHIPLIRLAEHFSEIPKNRKIVITDRFMTQSPLAAKMLIKADYDVSGVLKGGLSRWKAEELPTVNREE
jgi:rhodanese-related sulfurtransferase